MTDVREPKTHPSVWVIVKNIALAAWMYMAICSLISALVLSGFNIAAFILAIIFTLFIGGIITLAFSGLIIVPLMLFRGYARLTHRLLTLAICSLVAAGLAAIFVFVLPIDYSGNVIGASKPGALILITGTVFGTLAGWTGLQSAEKARTR